MADRRPFYRPEICQDASSPEILQFVLSHISFYSNCLAL